MHVTDLVTTFRGVNITIHGNQGTKHRLCFASGIVKSWHIHLPTSLCDGIWTVPLVPVPPVIAEYRQKKETAEMPSARSPAVLPLYKLHTQSESPSQFLQRQIHKTPPKEAPSYWSCGQIQGGKSIESLRHDQCRKLGVS